MSLGHKVKGFQLHNNKTLELKNFKGNKFNDSIIIIVENLKYYNLKMELEPNYNNEMHKFV